MSKEAKKNVERNHDLIDDLAKEMRYTRSGRRASSIFGIAFSQTVKPSQSNEELLDEWMKEKTEDDS